MPDPLRAAEIFDLTNRVGLIIGGAGKLGRQFAKVLSIAGARIIIADLEGARLAETRDLVKKETGNEITVLPCDVTREDDVNQLFAMIEREWGLLNFLVYNTMAKPSGYYQSFEKYTRATWDQVIGANLSGAFFSCQKAHALMKKKGGGSIVLTSSVYGIVGPDFRIYRECDSKNNLYGGDNPLTTPAPYPASKGGIMALTRYLATLLGPDGIRVNTLTPGGVYDGQEEGFHQAYVNKTPLGRMAVWSDYSGAILFLASDASKYMTGANLVIDGGWTAW